MRAICISLTLKICNSKNNDLTEMFTQEFNVHFCRKAIDICIYIMAMIM